MPMKEAILDLLKHLPADRQVEDRGSTAWMKCPVHGGGNEKTPSFKITLEGPYSGSHYCYGCGKAGPWKETVTTLGFKSSARFLSDEYVTPTFSTDDEERLLGKKPKDKKIDFRERWPRTQSWRGVPGSLITDVGGSMIIGGDGREPLLRLPAMVRGVERGWIDCKIRPVKDERVKYINSTGAWAKDVLYPYDYIRARDPRILALVEGPRDALITIRNGLPALAVLGATSWNQKCINLISALAPDLLILMLDPDDAGEKLRRRVVLDLRDHLPLAQIRLPHKFRMEKGVKKMVKLCDPGDLNRKKLMYAMELACIDISHPYRSE